MNTEREHQRVVAQRYRLLRRLGAGGMGQVWLAYDQQLSCEVSVKEILPGSGTGDSQDSPDVRIARARAEARHAARLRGHPHVVTVHDVVEYEGLPWIVMEYVRDAVDLQAYVERHGRLSPAEAARVGLGVLAALTAGHGLGIMHRDVKPANVLLAPDATGDPLGRVLLTDYGIAVRPASLDTRLTMSGVIGTLNYLAPERLAGAPPTPGGDLFSLGATLHYALEGRAPSLGDPPSSPLNAGPLTPALVRLLARDPAHRSTPEQAERAFRQVAGLPVTPPPPPRHRKALIVSVVAGLLVMTVVLWSLTDRTTSGTPAATVRHSAATSTQAPTPTGTPRGGPYGHAVGLDEPLSEGDCVVALWTGDKFRSLPKLSVVDCRKDWPDGQVVRTLRAGSYQEAQADGQRQCAQASDELVSRLAEGVAYAVPPSEEGWNHGTRELSCLVFSRSGAGIAGPLGVFRKIGEELELQNLSIGDCTTVKQDKKLVYHISLTDCGKVHDEQVIGFAAVPATVAFDKLRNSATDRCVDRYEKEWIRDASFAVQGWWSSLPVYDSGFRYVPCVLTRIRTPKLTEKIYPKTR
ncbi:MAG: protein kinase [Streptomyces sp.]|nr:protein kinase [Streptomyces sp.]